MGPKNLSIWSKKKFLIHKLHLEHVLGLLANLSGKQLGKITGYVTCTGHGCRWAWVWVWVGKFPPTRNPHPWVRVRGQVRVFFSLLATCYGLLLWKFFHLHHHCQVANTSLTVRKHCHHTPWWCMSLPPFLCGLWHAIVNGDSTCHFNTCCICYTRTTHIVRAYSNMSLSVLRALSKSLHLVSVI